MAKNSTVHRRLNSSYIWVNLRLPVQSVIHFFSKLHSLHIYLVAWCPVWIEATPCNTVTHTRLDPARTHLNTDSMYSPNDTVSPFNSQTNLGDLTEYDYQVSLNRVIIILLMNTKPVLCLNRAPSKPGYQRQNHSSRCYSRSGGHKSMWRIRHRESVFHAAPDNMSTSFRPTQKHLSSW